jgi:transposase
MVFGLEEGGGTLLVNFMPRYKPYDYRQGLMVPVTPEEQFLEGSLEYALHHLIEERIDESWFEDLYANDEFGRPAYSPKLLLKVILLGYARGIIGSRRLERACRENITFMALSCGIRPDHSTLAGFVEKLQGRIEVIFSEVLLVCHEEGLLSGTHLSLDGLKLPANASREWSGTFKELRLKADKLARKFREKLAEHRRQDRLDRKRPEGMERTPEVREKEKAARKASLQRLRQKAERIGEFLKAGQEKEGARGNEVQSNVTDNDTAKMQTSHGVIQGYNAQALVDEKHQVILHGSPSGCGQDHRQIAPMLEGAREMLELSGLGEAWALKQAVLSADCNYHSEANLQACEEHQMDACIPDNHFRSRDPRFDTQERHKSPFRGHEPHARYAPRKGCFGVESFSYNSATDTYTCPQGRELTCQSRSHSTGDGHRYRRYRSKAYDCAGCPLKARCIARGGARKSLAIPVGGEPATLTARMRRKIDTPQARRIYARRLAIIEPVFANLRSNKRLDHFTYRGKEKVSVQWLLYCLVHNFEKIAHFSRKYGPKGAKRALHTLLKRSLRFLTHLDRLLAGFSDPFRPSTPFAPALF